MSVKNLMYKSVIVGLLVVGYGVGAAMVRSHWQTASTERAMEQLREDRPELQQRLLEEHQAENNVYWLGWAAVAGLSSLLLAGDLRKVCTCSNRACCAGTFLMGLTVFSGCYRPFEPVQLEVINPNEEAFLLPYLGDAKKQTSSDNEEYLKASLVYTKQVKIPQQWVPRGYETFGPNGIWQPAAVLVKVDKSPVTREWTADSNSGTSNKNEAIWVMTSDQVEFSTGWTITARISSRDDAVKFLHNYPNGSLKEVMDTEVRSKIQAEFGLEVTDLPMDTLRKAATPHISNVTTNVEEFFKERGITITNLGISGGFVYKDKTILDTMVKVFNAEQEKAVAAAETAAQEERNKKLILEATGKADALLKSKEAESEGIKLVADAKVYELEKSTENWESYVALKQFELQKELLTKWDGSYPRFFLGGSDAGSNPNFLLQLPPIESVAKGVQK